MKKLSQILAVGVITLMPLAIGGNAFAAGVCDIGFTGPDSNNQCISTTEFECTVVNDTTVSVTNENIQIAVSGDAGSTGNTSAGSASTGSATNSNGTTFNATVTNATESSPGICTVVATMQASGGRGSVVAPTAAVPAPSGGKGAVAVAVLPNTSSDSTMAYLAGLVGMFGAGAIISRLAVIAYGRIKSQS
ncbi:hypothetical protein H7X68_01710 [Candidatus Saccharibacteria bacterium]|nr:hypothetical protein [Candidatus Saccharibacteria bacterium]